MFKTRAQAADACRGGRVKIDEIPAKPSRIIKEGYAGRQEGSCVLFLFVVQLTERRLSAKEVPLYARDCTSEEELAKLQQPRESIVIYRQKGTGRPTKKERRQLDKIRGINE